MIGLGLGLNKNKSKSNPGGLLDKYPGAEAAYSLRALSVGFNDPVIRVRRSLDDAESDFLAGEIADGTLENWVNGFENASTLVGDHGGGAVAAYSLRYVVSAYAGSVVRVRRSSDDTEQDFNPTEVTDGTLESFCGAGDGFVTTLYDQSGNSYNATQSTTANQPKIIDSGSLILEGGRPSVEFDGTNDYLSLPTLSVPQALSQIIVARLGTLSTNTGFPVVISSAIAGNRVQMVAFDDSANNFNAFAGSVNLNYAADVDHHIWFGLANGASSSIYQDGVLRAGPANIGSQTLSSIQLGGQINGLNVWQGTIQEVVVYADNQSDNRPSIGQNQSNYYNIPISSSSDGFVKTWYDQSGNSNNATQDITSSQPKVVDGGNLILEGGNPVIRFNGTSQYFTSTYTSGADVSVFLSAKANSFSGASANARYFDLHNGVTSLQFTRDSSTTNWAMKNSAWQGGAISSGFGSATTDYGIFTLLYKSSSNEFYVDGSSIASTGSPSVGIAGATTTIGQRADILASTYFNGVMRDLIIYNSDQSANRVAIESQMSN